MLQGDKIFKASFSNTTNAQAWDGGGNSAITLSGWVLTNTTNAAHTIKFFDKASAPSAGNDTPKISVTVGATSTVSHSFTRGVTFVNGGWVNVTTGAGDTDNNATAANAAVVSVFYQP